MCVCAHRGFWFGLDFFADVVCTLERYFKNLLTAGTDIQTAFVYIKTYLKSSQINFSFNLCQCKAGVVLLIPAVSSAVSAYFPCQQRKL